MDLNTEKCHRTYIHGPHKKCSGMKASDYLYVDEEEQVGEDIDPDELKKASELLGVKVVDSVEEENQLLQEKIHDNVNHPAHYTQYKGIEVIDLTSQMNFNRGNAVKYICRAGFKSPETELEDLRKARWYLDHEINRILRSKEL